MKVFLGLYARESSRRDVEGVVGVVGSRVSYRLVGPSFGWEYYLTRLL